MSKGRSSVKSLVLLLIVGYVLAVSPTIVGAASVATQSFPSQGPLPDQLVFKFYQNAEDGFYAFSGREIDLLDNVCVPEDWVSYPEWFDDNMNGSSQMEACFTFFGINCRNAHYPLNVTGFRKALAFLADRETLVWDGLGCNVYVVDKLVPYALFLEWSNPGVPYYRYSLVDANNTLWRYGFTYNGSCSSFPFTGGNWNGPDGKPIRPTDGSDNITIYYRSDQPLRKLAAELLERAMKDLDIPARAQPSTPIIIQQVIFQPPFAWDIYTGACSIPDDPDYLWYFFNSGSSQDLSFVGWINATFDYWSNRMIGSINLTEVKEACYKCQELLADALPYITLCSGEIVTGGSTKWKGWIDHVGLGLMNFYSLLQAHPANANRGGTLRAGLTMSVGSLNPISASSWADWYVLDEIFDLLIRRDPETRDWQPWMAESYDLSIFNWTSTEQGLKATFSLRDNLTWHDGAKVTSSDIEFTYRWLNMPPSRGGIEAPLYQLPFVIDRIETPDQLTAIIYCNTTSYFALSSLADFPLLPKHIWSKYTTLENATAVHPEQTGELIGSGPYSFVRYILDENITLSANRNYFREPTSVLGPTSVLTLAMFGSVAIAVAIVVIVMVRDRKKPVVTRYASS